SRPRARSWPTSGPDQAAIRMGGRLVALRRGGRPPFRFSGTMGAMRPMTARLALLLVLAPGAAWAETAPAAAPPPVEAPAPADVPPSWRDHVTLEGLLDAYYAYQVGGAGVQSLSPHVFDDAGNSFVLAYAKLGLGVKAD